MSNIINEDTINSDVDTAHEPERHIDFSSFIGQKDAISLLKISCAAARAKNKLLEHVLLTGKPGLGKTLLEEAIINEMGCDSKFISGSILNKESDLVTILTNLKEGDFLIVDDIDRMNKKCEDILYTAMGEFAIHIMLGKGLTANAFYLEIPRFTLLATSYKDDQISDALKSRFGLYIELQPYLEEELGIIITRQAESSGLYVDSESALLIAKVANGTPRKAITLLNRVSDYALINGKTTITKETTKQALDLIQKVSGKTVKDEETSVKL